MTDNSSTADVTRFSSTPRRTAGQPVNRLKRSRTSMTLNEQGDGTLILPPCRWECLPRSLSLSTLGGEAEKRRQPFPAD